MDDVRFCTNYVCIKISLENWSSPKIQAEGRTGKKGLCKCTTTIVRVQKQQINPYYRFQESHSALFHFLIKDLCKDIIHIGANTEEYYHIELVCDEDTDIEYGIQAYGEEAKELYKEISGFTSSLHDNKYREQERLKLIKQAINCIADCYLDNGCTLMFKKLRNICVSKKKILKATYD